MTLKELSQFNDLKSEIEEDKQRLAELRARATSMNPCLTGMPRAGGITDKTALAVEIAYLDELYEKKIKRADDERCKLLEYISGIPDSFTRRIFMYRFYDGYNWTQVAMHIGGGNTPKCLSNICYRYIGKRNNQS